VFVEQTDGRFYEPELHRRKGELLLQTRGHGVLSSDVLRSDLQQGALDAEAETSFQRALTLARQRQMKSLELRAAMSLSRLWQEQGKGQEAYELLAPIYGWFTEGFDTADLREARALSDELANL
jgi:predicted ATPase